MKPNRRILSFAVLALAGALLLAACSSTSSSTSSPSSAKPSATPTTVTVAYVPLPLFEPLFVAMHAGYFTKAGINVHLTVVPSGEDANALAATNKVQVVLGGFSAGMFNSIHQGLNFQVVGSMAEEAPGTPANGLVVAKSLKASGQVTNAGDLKGKKIAVDGGSGSAGAYLVAAALAPYHVTLSQVTLVNLTFGDMGSALQSGAVAAAYESTPFLGTVISSGYGDLLAGAPTGVAVTGVIYGGTFAHSAAAQPFFSALVKAAKTLQGSAANSKANLEIVANATGEKLSLLESEPRNVFSPNLAPPVATLEGMQKVFLQAGNLDYKTLIPSSTYVNAKFSNAAGS